MGIYRLDLDLLETAKKEYRSAAEKISADIGTSHKAVRNTGADIYKGIDADIFRRDFTGYVNKDFTEAWETVSKIGTTLESGLDHARECKKLCNDFPTALGGASNGRGKEDMRGELYCDQSMISTLKACCTSAMLHAQEVRVLSRVTDMILGELQMVRLDPTQYTDVVRDGCDKVDKLDAHSRELTVYAAAAETMDDSLKSALDVCLPFGWYVKPGCRADEELSPQAEVLVEIMGKQADELSDTDQELLDRNLRILMENNNISELRKVAERIGNGADGTWTVSDAFVAEKVLDKNGILKMKDERTYNVQKIIREIIASVKRNIDELKDTLENNIVSTNGFKTASIIIDSNHSQNADKDNVDERSGNVENVRLFPKPGDTITISKGIDLADETAVVSSWNTWSREYSVEGCNKNYAGDLCCKRLNYAIENYDCNSTDNDLLMFNLEGYADVVFAGAMVEGYANIGDIVQVTLDDSSKFNFLILDVKSTQHSSHELFPNNQIQCEWGHGYMLGEDMVQLSVCEFITAGGCNEANVQNTKSGAFLKKRSVIKTQIIDHIQIGD